MCKYIHTGLVRDIDSNMSTKTHSSKTDSLSHCDRHATFDTQSPTWLRCPVTSVVLSRLWIIGLDGSDDAVFPNNSFATYILRHVAAFNRNKNYTVHDIPFQLAVLMQLSRETLLYQFTSGTVGQHITCEPFLKRPPSGWNADIAVHV